MTAIDSDVTVTRDPAKVDCYLIRPADGTAAESVSASLLAVLAGAVTARGDLPVLEALHAFTAAAEAEDMDDANTVEVPAGPGRCCYCGLAGPEQLFEPCNKAGNLACRATAACSLRCAGADPVHELSVLLRAVRKELGILTGDQLVTLATDLTGYHDAVLRLLTAQGVARVTAEQADREARAAGKAEGTPS